MESTLPVLIIGAGPTGLSLATQLQRCGTPFRIIDPKPEIKVESRALGVHCRTIEIFRQLGILDKMKERSRDFLFRMTVFYEGNRLGQFQIPESDYPDPRPMLLSQFYTETFLRENLSKFGCQVEQLELVSFQQEADHVAVTLMDPNHAEGEVQAIYCKYMIGCDGARSIVRKQLGLAFPGMVRDRQWALIDLEMETDIEPNSAYAFWTKTENALCLPFDGFYRFIIDYGSLEEEVEVTEEKVLESLHALVKPKYFHPKKVIWLSKFKINERMVPVNYQGQVFLCGDAAHIHSPAGGFGMNTGIQDAYHLGWMLTLMTLGAVNSKTFSEIYWAERKLVAKRVLQVAGNATTAVITKSTFLIDFARKYILPILFKFPFVAKIMTSTGSGRYIKFPSSVLTHQPFLRWLPGYNNVVGERFQILPLKKLGDSQIVQLQNILSGRYTFDIIVYVRNLGKSHSQVKGLVEQLNDPDGVISRTKAKYELKYPLVSVKIVSPQVQAFDQFDENSPLQAFNECTIYEDLENKMKGLLPLPLTFSNAVLIVRPDGYIGKISSLKNPNQVTDYFKQLFLTP